MCAAVAAAPAVAFAATNDENGNVVNDQPTSAASVQLREDAKHNLDAAVHRAKERRKKALQRRRARALAKQQQSAAPAQAAGGSTTTPGNLQAIAACESGGDPSAVGGGGAFRGKYQFDYGTWQSVGGSGDPAAAPEAEQDQRAAMLYSRSGSNPWPVCGR